MVKTRIKMKRRRGGAEDTIYGKRINMKKYSPSKYYSAEDGSNDEEFYSASQGESQKSLLSKPKSSKKSPTWADIFGSNENENADINADINDFELVSKSPTTTKQLKTTKSRIPVKVYTVKKKAKSHSPTATRKARANLILLKEGLREIYGSPTAKNYKLNKPQSPQKKIASPEYNNDPLMLLKQKSTFEPNLHDAVKELLPNQGDINVGNWHNFREDSPTNKSPKFGFLNTQLNKKKVNINATTQKTNKTAQLRAAFIAANKTRKNKRL